VRIEGSGLDLSSSQSGRRNESLSFIKFGENFHCLLACERNLFCTNLITPRMLKERFVSFASEFNH